MGAGTCRDQKRVLGPLELELQVVVSYWAWVFGTGPGSSERVICAFNY